MLLFGFFYVLSLVSFCSNIGLTRICGHLIVNVICYLTPNIVLPALDLLLLHFLEPLLSVLFGLDLRLNSFGFPIFLQELWRRHHLFFGLHRNVSLIHLLEKWDLKDGATLSWQEVTVIDVGLPTNHVILELDGRIFLS